MRKSDHIHLRCPGNISLIGCILQIFYPGKQKTVKYAGNWDPKAEQPLSYNLQKWILSNTFLTRNMKVLVYGNWPKQTKNIHPFFTASFSEREKAEVREKKFESPFSFIFVGNLVPGKHPLKAIQLVLELEKNFNNIFQGRESHAVKLEIYGDGPERKMLEAYCRDEKREALVEFKGNRPLEELKEAYQAAHFLILPSQSEGWPKAIAEAMFFGCIPVSTSVSCVPWMLGFGERGILASPAPKGGMKAEEWVKIGKDVEELIKDQEKMRTMSLAAQEWSQQYTIERFEIAIKEVLNKTKN